MIIKRWGGENMRLPLWLLKLLPMWEYFCPACRSSLDEDARSLKICPDCGLYIDLSFEKLRAPPGFLKDAKRLSDYVHKHIFPTLSDAERDYLAQWFTEIFSDGFESNDFSAWDGTWGTPQVQDVTVHCGSYAALFEGNEGCYKYFTAESEAYLRFYINYAALPDNASKRVVIFDELGVGGIVLYYEDDGGKQFRLHNSVKGTTIGTWATTINTGQWYCLEIHYKADTNGTDGEAHLWVDGTQRISSTTEDFDLSTVDRGAFFFDPFTDIEIYVDCVIIADIYIGPEEEGISIPVFMRTYRNRRVV